MSHLHPPDQRCPAKYKGPGALSSSGKVPREGGTGGQPSILGGWGCSSREPPLKRLKSSRIHLATLGHRALSSKVSQLKLPTCSVSSFPLILHCVLVLLCVSPRHSQIDFHQIGPDRMLNKYLLREAVSQTLNLCGHRTRCSDLPPSGMFSIYLKWREVWQCI